MARKVKRRPPRPPTYLLVGVESELASAVRGVLEGLNLTRVEDWTELRASDPLSALTDFLEDTDLVVAVVDETFRANVAFELGVAAASGKLIVGILPRGFVEIPPGLSQATWLRLEDDDPAKLQFAFKTFAQELSHRYERRVQARQVASHASPQLRTERSVPRLAESVRAREDRVLRPIGSIADRLIGLTRARPGLAEAEAALCIEEALRAAGVHTIVKGPRDAGFDLAIWAPGLEKITGNPLPIELKIYDEDRVVPDASIWQVESYRQQSSATYAVLITNGRYSDRTRAGTPNVIKFTCESLFAALRRQPLDEVLLRAIQPGGPS